MRKAALFVALLAVWVSCPAWGQRHRLLRRRAGGTAHARRVRHRISVQTARRASVQKVVLKHKLHGLSGSMHAVRARIHAAKSRERHLAGAVGATRQRVTAAKERLDRIDDKLDILAREHDQVVTHLTQVGARLALRRRLLGVRIRDSYMHGQIGYAQVLLNASSFQELLSRGVYVRQIVKSDATLVNAVQEDQARIHSDKLVLEAHAREEQQLAAEYEQQKLVYQADLQQEQQVLEQTRAQRQAAEEQLDVMESEAEAMTSRIRELSALLEKRRQEQEEAQWPVRRRRTFEPPISQPRAVWRGSFIRPCSGPITSPFGWRYHPILHVRRFHSGVDIGAPYGTTIRAAASGTVILASYVRGYGNCIVIDHGGGVTTLYGHCSVLLVSEGESVDQGQPIARVGATGLATGPHLHFEVRHNGVPVNPMGG